MSDKFYKTSITIERSNKLHRDIIEYNGLKKSYLFQIRPSVLYNLFKEIGFQLFFSNIRNPIVGSYYNTQIADSITNNPEEFWLFNNGISAITPSNVEIGQQATTIQIDGLQIINGAQTVYSIYSVYNNLNEIERSKIDDKALISFRLICSSDPLLNLRITKFTNSQNPISSRDFFANDSIQERLQQESFSTNIWYEKRANEFRSIPEGVTLMPNSQIAHMYACFEKLILIPKEKKNLLFVSKDETSDGLYEVVFNEYTTFQDMHASFAFFKIGLICIYDKINPAVPPTDETLMPLSIFLKILTTKYLKLKYSSSINVNRYIIEHRDDPNFHSINKQLLNKIYSLLDGKYINREDFLTWHTSSSILAHDVSLFETIKIEVNEIDLNVL